MGLLDLDELDLLLAQCPKEMPSVYDAPAFSSYLFRWQRYTSALEAAAPDLIAAARREREARALVEDLTRDSPRFDSVAGCFYCTQLASCVPDAHDPECAYRRSRLWLRETQDAGSVEGASHD